MITGASVADGGALLGADFLMRDSAPRHSPTTRRRIEILLLARQPPLRRAADANSCRILSMAGACRHCRFVSRIITSLMTVMPTVTAAEIAATAANSHARHQRYRVVGRLTWLLGVADSFEFHAVSVTASMPLPAHSRTFAFVVLPLWQRLNSFSWLTGRWLYWNKIVDFKQQHDISRTCLITPIEAGSAARSAGLPHRDGVAVTMTTARARRFTPITGIAGADGGRVAPATVATDHFTIHCWMRERVDAIARRCRVVVKSRRSTPVTIGRYFTAARRSGRFPATQSSPLGILSAALRRHESRR